MPLANDRKLKYLNEIMPLTRATMLVDDLHYELSLLEYETSLDERVEINLEQNQKEFILKEKLRIINEELGVSENPDVDRLETRLKNLDAPKNIKKRIEEEKRAQEEDEQRQLRDAIAKKYANEIEDIRNRARKRSVLKYIGFLFALLGFFSILWGGVQEMRFLIGIGGALFIFALPFIVMGDVVSDQEVKLFIERKINEEKNTTLDSHEKEINS